MTEKRDLQDVIRHIQKLLALGTSPNENEAAAAVAKAQELMQSYDLSMESLGDLKADERTSIGHGRIEISTTSGKPEGWKAELLHVVAQTSDCYVVVANRWEQTRSGKYREIKDYKLVGFKHDLEIAGYEIAFLISEIERLAQDYANTMWYEIRELRDQRFLIQHEAESAYTRETGRHPLKAKLYFIKGAAQTVGYRLVNEYHQRRNVVHNDNPHAIIFQKRDAVADFLYKEQYGMTKAEWEAEQDRIHKKWVAEHGEHLAKLPKSKPETDIQRRKREEREERARRKREDTYQRQQRREYQKMDHVALGAGQEAGEHIVKRKGLRGGEINDQLK